MLKLFIDWSGRFDRKKIDVFVKEECFSNDYGYFSEIEILPKSIYLPKINILIVEDTVGFSIECYSRIYKRLIALGVIRSIPVLQTDFVAAYLEPGVKDKFYIQKLLDSIASRGGAIEVDVFGNKIINSNINIDIDAVKVKMNGLVKFGWVNYFGGKKIIIQYSGLI